MFIIPQLCSAQNVNQPKYYLNQEEYNKDSVFLYLNNIDSIHVAKVTSAGEVFIRTKDQPWEYYTLKELMNRTPLYQQFIDKSITLIYIIDGKVINKMSDAKIDKAYFAKVTFGRLSNVNGLSNKSRKLVIINIVLSKTDPYIPIHIRGNSLINTGI
jgi:hypothetical protein